MSHRRRRLFVARALTSFTALLVGLGIAACSDSPVQPGNAKVPTPQFESRTLDAGLDRCREFLDPDWLCESQALRDRLCEVARGGGSIDFEIKVWTGTVRYRVSFQPQVDGSLVVSVARVKADGTLVPIGSVTVPPEKVAKFLEGCPAPDPTNMVFRTTWQSGSVVVQREHRAVAGEPTPLDVDATAGPDVVADIDYALSGIAVALQRPEGAASLSFTIDAVRDAAAADDRSVSMTIDALPTNLSLALDYDARRITGSASEAVARFFAQIGAGSGQVPGALAVVATAFALVGSFEINCQSGAQLTSTAAIDHLEVRVRSANRQFVNLPSGHTGVGVAMVSDPEGLGLTISAPRTRQISVQAPLSVAVSMDVAPQARQVFVEVLTPGKRANLRVAAAPLTFTFGLAEADPPNNPRAALTWQSSTFAPDILVGLNGISGADGRVTALLGDVPSSFVMSFVVPPAGSGQPLRLDTQSNAGTADVELSAVDATGLRRLFLSLVNIPTALRGCLAHDGSCRPTDRLPGPLADYREFLVDNLFQSSTAGGLNRPYPAHFSLDFEGVSGIGGSLSTKMSATLDRGDGKPITITDLWFRSVALDLGVHPTSPDFTFEGTSFPRLYMYVDSHGQPYVLGNLRMPELIQSVRIGGLGEPAAAGAFLTWLPGAKCTQIDQLTGFCVTTDFDPRASGSNSCGRERVFLIRSGGVDYDLLNVLGSQALRLCTG